MKYYKSPRKGLEGAFGSSGCAGTNLGGASDLGGASGSLQSIIMKTSPAKDKTMNAKNVKNN